MFINHFKIAIRNITKHKIFSTIKILSLAIGLSTSFVIGLMAYYDLTFDEFHPKGDNIYRITSTFISSDGESYNPGVTIPLASNLKEGLSGIETVAPLFITYPLHVRNLKTTKLFKNPEFAVYADNGFFELFEYEWLAGSSDAILENPNELILSENRAKTYFPDTEYQDILGSTLVYQDSIAVKVTGIVANFEERTDIIFEEFISLKTAESFDMTGMLDYAGWDSTNSASQLFVGVTNNVDVTTVQSELDKIAKTNVDPTTKSFNQTNKFNLQPLGEMHFDRKYYLFDFSETQASKSILFGLFAIAIFLLLLGCINFINLNTAQAAQRAKEIGIRKTLGSSRKQLVFQFLVETFVLTLCAAVISLFLSAGLLRAFSDFIPKELDLSLFLEPVVMGGITLLLLVITFLSGLYPGVVLSHFKPVTVFKNRLFNNGDKTSLRKYLTVFQFVIAQVFIIGTILVGKQLNFMTSKNMGIATEAIANIRTPWFYDSEEKRILLMKEISANPMIEAVSLSSNPPASFSTSSKRLTYFGPEKEEQTLVQFLFGDGNYLKMYDIELLAGRKALNDTIKELVINESYLKRLGFAEPKDALGENLKLNEENYPIVGVMKDFNQRSLKSGIAPMALAGDWNRDRFSQFKTVHFSLVKGQSEHWPKTIAQIEESWNNIYPDADFEVQFMSEMVQRFYEEERKTATLMSWAMGFSIVISCLGLLGLVVYTTERRTKEIGIRKVLGASLAQLSFLLCKEFLILVGIAFVVAVPIAWYGVHDWLQDFAYKTNMSWWVFALSGLTMLLIALLITGLRTVAKANANPVKSLRTE